MTDCVVKHYGRKVQLQFFGPPPEWKVDTIVRHALGARFHVMHIYNGGRVVVGRFCYLYPNRQLSQRRRRMIWKALATRPSGRANGAGS